MKRTTINDLAISLNDAETDALCNAINGAPDSTVVADHKSLPYFTATWAKDCAEVGIDMCEDRDLEPEEETELEALKSALQAITLGETAHAESAKAEERLTAAVEAAQEAFWAAIAEAYPEAETGDLDPPVVMSIEAEMTSAVRAWVDANTTTEAN